MKILTFIHSFHPGGVERVALRLVRDWRSRGIAAPLFVGRAEGVMLGDVGKDLDFDTPRQPGFGSAWWETFWMIHTLPRAIREQQPDILFCAGNSLTVVAFFIKWRLGRRCPPILVKISNELQWRHRSAWARFWYRIWLWLQARTFTGVVAMEQAMVPEIIRYLHVRPEQVAVIQDPALTPELLHALKTAARPAWQRGQPRRFVAVGRLVRQKNLALMLDAFARGAGPQDSLDLIGEGADRVALKAQVDAFGLGERVRFVGYRPEPALDLARYDALLLSSDFEGVPAVLLEALAAGIDIVATECSASVASLLGNGRFGTLVPPRDRDALAAAIAALVPGTQDRAASFAQVRGFTTRVAGPAYVRLAAAIAGKPATMHDVDRVEDRYDNALSGPGYAFELPRGRLALTADRAPIHVPVI